MALFCRGFVTVLTASIFLTACEATLPPLGPIDAKPGVQASAVRDDLDIFANTNADAFLDDARKRLDPERMGTQAHHDLMQTMAPGELSFTRVRTLHQTRLFFAAHSVQGYSGIVLDRSPDNHPVAPVDWIRAAVSFEGASPTAIRAWCVAMSERLAGDADASGIAVFSNGNAMGIDLDIRGDDDNGDYVLMVRTKFFKAGEYDAKAWGPRIDGATTASVRKMNGHEGVSIRDLIDWKLIVPHGVRGPYPEPLSGSPPPPSPADSSSAAPSPPTTNL